MNPNLKRAIGITLVLAAISALTNCVALNQIASTLSSLRNVKFKLGDVHGFRLAGIDISGKTRLSQFSALDALALLNAFRSKKLDADFVLDVLAVNPNDGTGGGIPIACTLSGLDSRLLIDNKPTVAGEIERPVDIPGTGKEIVIPLRFGLDLIQFFGEKGYDDLIDLALAIGGSSRNTARLSLDAQPRITTAYGTLTYPGRLTIINAEFR